MFEHPPPLSEVDVLASPDAVAAELATSLPRAEDTSALAMLDPDTLSDAGRVDLLVAFERSIALLQAGQQQVLASLDGRALDWSGTKLIDYTREQVGAALRLSPGTAERRLSIARTLLERLPATLELLRGGQLTYLHAMKLAAAVIPFDAETTTKIEQRVLRRAPEQTLAQFGTALRRAVIAADPRRAEQRHDDAITQRRVVFTPQHDGITKHCGRYYPPTAPRSSRRCSTPSATPRPMTAARINAAPTRSSTCSPGHSVTRPCPNSTESAPPSTSPSHSAPCPACDNQPAHLDRYGPITAEMARRIAADQSGTWRRLVTDDTGQLLDYRRTTHRPPTNLTNHATARDRTCTFPACRHAAKLSDLDHVEAWTDGGDTNPANLAAPCARHHNAKHHASWQVKHRQDGTREWIGPAGHTYARPPDDG